MKSTMTNILNSVFVVILCLLIFTNAQPNYICTNPQPLNDPSRNVNISCTICNKCDAISKGFYYFKPNAKIPNFCPTMYVCSTETTYWSNDTQPTTSNPGPFNISLCLSISANGNDSDCYSSCSSVQAAFCSNINAVVYELSPVPMCNTRYCFQEFIPCGKNESSKDGYQPCIQNFPFNQLPNGTTGFVSSNTTNRLFTAVRGVYAKCTIQCPLTLNCSNVTGDVFWFSGGSSALSFYNSTLLYESTTNELYGYANESTWQPYLNTYLSCKILPRFNGLQPSFYLYTTPYYFGLKLSVKQSGRTYQIQNYYDQKQVIITLKEATPKTNAVIEIYSTIPILCNATKSCNLQISMAREDIYNATDRYRINNCGSGCNSCQRSLNNQSQEDPSNNATWNIVPTVEASNLNEGIVLYIDFFVLTTQLVIGAFWNNILLPRIKLINEPLDMTMAHFAHSYNDPHIKTFDGTLYDFHNHTGEYLMMENNDTLLRIHAISTDCSELGIDPRLYTKGNYCNDRLFIQSIDDVIIHDIKNKSSLYYKDLNVKQSTRIIIPFGTDGNAIIPKTNVIQISKSANRFKIITHFATVIYIYYDGNFEVFPSKMDFNKTWGLLGNYDLDNTNDLTLTNAGNVLTNESFFKTYQIQRPRPFMEKDQYYNLSDTELNKTMSLSRYCMCLNTTGNLELGCPLGLTQIGQRNAKSKQNILISMERLVKLNEKIETSHKLKHFSNEKIKKRRLARQTPTDSCERTLNIPVFQNCHNQNLINLTQLIFICKLDFQLTNLDIWASQYYESTLHVSKTQLLNYKNNFVNVNGTKQSQTDLLSKLCLNNCSNHGICTELGVCICNSPYSGDDCSIDRSIPANIYNSTMDLNVCDLRNNKSCTELVLLVDRISPNMTVTVTSYYRNDSKNLVHSRTTSSIISFSDNLIYVELSLIDQIANGFSSVLFYKITLKDLSISAPFFYAIYDSDCQTCDDQANCFVNDNTCNINNNCYKNDEVNPNNPDEICNSTNSQYKWSLKTPSFNNQTMICCSSTRLTSNSMAAIIVACVVIAFELMAGLALWMH